MPPRRLRPRPLGRRLQRARIPLAVVLALAAGGMTALHSAGSTVETTPAVRLSNDVAAGETLTAQSVEVTALDARAVPENHSGDPGRYIGETVAAPLPRGAVLHESQLVGPGLLAGRDGGTVAVPVRPADTAILGLLTPGQHVDVLVSTDMPEAESGTRRIASAAPVLWTPRGPGETWLGGGAGAASEGDVVVLGVEPEIAEIIAQATHEGRLHLSVVSDAPRVPPVGSGR